MPPTRARRSVGASAPAAGVKRSQRIQELQLKSQAIAHEAEIMHKEDDKRRLRVRTTVAEGEKAELKDDIQALTAKLEEVTAQLEASEQACQLHEVKIQSQARDISLLKAEIKSMGTVSKDSAKILTEKLSLTRELDSLKPELEHLRLQVANHQQAIAEKLALEQQVASLETQIQSEKRGKQQSLTQEQSQMKAQITQLEKKLAAEKKAKEKLEAIQQKASDKKEHSDEEKSELASKVKELERKLAAEIKEKETLRKDTERELADAAADNESLQEKLETVKIKARELRDDLRSTKAQLEAAETRANTTLTDFADKARSKASAAPKPTKKRKADEIEDLAISTPGIAEGKNKKTVQAKPGQKSEFSITPFLNRTMGPDEDPDVSVTIDTPSAAPKVAPRKAEPKPDPPQPPARGKTRSRLSEVTTIGDLEDEETEVEVPASPKPSPKPAAKSRGRAAKAASEPVVKPTAAKSLLDEPADEEDVGPVPPSGAANTFKKPAAKTLKAKSASQENEQTKKKRKVLGGTAPKTLFEDDDDEAGLGIIPPTKRAPVGLGGAKAGARGGKSAVGSLKKGAFGKAFSPLKKDRRGVGASFLV